MFRSTVLLLYELFYGTNLGITGSASLHSVVQWLESDRRAMGYLLDGCLQARTMAPTD